MKSNFGRGGARAAMSLNEDLIIPDWAKKDETLKERLAEKKKVVRVNPDRLDPIPRQFLAARVRSVLNRTLDPARKGPSSKG